MVAVEPAVPPFEVVSEGVLHAQGQAGAGELAPQRVHIAGAQGRAAMRGPGLRHQQVLDGITERPGWHGKGGGHEGNVHVSGGHWPRSAGEVRLDFRRYSQDV